MNDLLREELVEVQNIQQDIWTGEVEEEKAKERFKITSLESANWAFRKLKAIEEKESEIRDLMDKEIKRIQDWAKQDIDKINDSREFFEFLLEEYYREQRALDPKFKLSTPYGKVSSRKQQDKWIYDDETILESLKERQLDKFIKVKEEVNKAELKKEVNILTNVYVLNGEILGHVNVERNEEMDYVFIDNVDIETGEVYDSGEKDYEFYEKVVACNGKMIDGIKIEPQPDSITIKVEA